MWEVSGDRSFLYVWSFVLPRSTLDSQMSWASSMNPTTVTVQTYSTWLQGSLTCWGTLWLLVSAVLLIANLLSGRAQSALHAVAELVSVVLIVHPPPYFLMMCYLGDDDLEIFGRSRNQLTSQSPSLFDISWLDGILSVWYPSTRADIS